MIERTIHSIKNQILNTKSTIDIICLENPSKYSHEIKQIIHKHNKIIKYHYISNVNIAGKIFQLFINKYKQLLSSYDLIYITEGDVILDNKVLQETINLFNKYNAKIVYTGLKTHNKKYNTIQHLIHKWVIKPKLKTHYNIGHTGFQFIGFLPSYLFELIISLNNKNLKTKIALGVSNYEYISDSNLHKFNQLNNTIEYQTKFNLLEHIGWETAIGLHPEYQSFKRSNISKIRSNNINTTDIIITEVS